ncbi:hypothetical protein [Sinorhizobium meliloti]|uniref:hypothetical protein n=1 Tax=Rhizobium meliloti TaxID=382 RepID=UPI001314473E|nr:hypothetical protein [Sinorhizobium meliloti]MDE4618777.1 hypothetical protein [Sinorhizobium meliloti]
MSFDAGVAWYLIRDCCTNDFIWLGCQPLLPQHAAALGFDLTYLSIHDRETTLKNIDTILEHIREDLPRNFAWCERPEDRRAGNNDTRVLVRQGPLMALNAQTGCNFPA